MAHHNTSSFNRPLGDSVRAMCDDQSDHEQQRGMGEEASNEDDDNNDDDDEDDAHPDHASSVHTMTRRNTSSVHHLLGGRERRSMNDDVRCYSKQQTKVDDDASNDVVGDDDSDGDLGEDMIDRELVGNGSSSPGITPTIPRPVSAPPPSTTTRLPSSVSSSSSSSGDATYYLRKMIHDDDATLGSNVSLHQGLDTEMVISTTIGQSSINRHSSTSGIPIRTPRTGSSSSALGAAMVNVSNSLSVHRRTRSATRNVENEPMDISNRS